jgi:hypothetical protein
MQSEIVTYSFEISGILTPSKTGCKWSAAEFAAELICLLGKLDETVKSPNLKN